MPRVQVTKFHPVQIGASLGTPVTIKNIKGSTAYYTLSPDSLPTSTTKDGEIAETESVTLYNQSWWRTVESTDTELEVSPAATKVGGEAAVGTSIPGRRLITEVTGYLLEKSADKAVNFVNNGQWEKATALKISFAEKANGAFFFVTPSLFEVTGRVSQVTLDVIMLCDNVAPTSTFAFGLFKVEKSEAAEKKLEVTYETVLSVPKAEITAPAAKSITHAEATGATPAEGVYSIGFETKTESVAKSYELITAKLYANS